MRITRSQSYLRLPAAGGYPGVTNKELWRGVLRACGVEPKAYKFIANLTFANVGSGGSIHFTTDNAAGVWARAWIYGWGRGKIAYSAHPDVMKGWAKFRAEGSIDNVLMGLAFHELGHIIGNTANQAIGYPPQAWFVKRLVGHYGGSRSKAKAMASIVAADPIEVVLPLDDLSWIPKL